MLDAPEGFPENTDENFLVPSSEVSHDSLTSLFARILV